MQLPKLWAELYKSVCFGQLATRRHALRPLYKLTW